MLQSAFCKGALRPDLRKKRNNAVEVVELLLIFIRDDCGSTVNYYRHWTLEEAKLWQGRQILHQERFL